MINTDFYNCDNQDSSSIDYTVYGVDENEFFDEDVYEVLLSHING